MNRIRHWSIFHKLAGTNVSLVLLLGILLSYVTLASLHELNSRQQEKRGLEIGGHVASLVASPILVNDRYTLSEILHEFKNETDDLRYLLVFDHTGQLLAHTFPTRLPEGLRSANPIPLRTEPRIVELQTNEGLIRDILSPVENGAIGYIRAGLSEEFSKALIGKTTGSLLMITVFFCSVAAGLAILLSRFITAPVNKLVDSAQAIAAGNLAARAPVSTGDELGKLALSFNEMASELQEKEQLRASLLHQVITAQEAERKRLSRELHDETGQALTSLIVSMRVLANKAADDRQRELLLSARDVAAEVLLDIRNMAVELRPTALDDLGLAAAMRKYAADFQERFGITVHFAADLAIPALDSDLSVTLYRIMQEGLTNAARHSGATNVDIRLEATTGAICLKISDNGKGLPSGELERALREKRLGIYGMQERVELCGGQFSLESTPGSGATISVSIPLTSKGA
jgi:signal transduction histidine kinase